LRLVSCSAYLPEVYQELREADVADAAAAFARAGNLPAVAALLRRHPYALAPRVLDALAAAPECLDPKLYEPLLRDIAALGQPPAPARRADWAESEATCAALRRRGEHAALLATEPMARLNLGWAPPSARQLAAWVAARAMAVDRLSGQLAAAAALLEAARAALHYGGDAAALAPLQRAAAQLLMLLKLGAGRGAGGGEGGEEAGRGGAWDLRLGEFAALDDAGRLQALLQLLGSEGLARDIPAAVVPFIAQLESPDPEGTLRRVLEREAPARLSWVVKFVQLEAGRPAALGSAAGVAAAAVAAAYACPSADSWSLQEALLHAAADALSRGRGADEGERAAAGRRLAAAHGHLTAARLLTKHGLPTPLAAVRDAGAEEAGRLVGEVVARAARGRASEGRWADLWADLEAVREGGLEALPEGAMRAVVCTALLESSQPRLAEAYLPGLPPARREALVLAAARACFIAPEGAAAGEDIGDAAAAAAAKKAKAILAALPGSPAAAEEARFVDAAQRLRALGVGLPPDALRRAPNKAQLLGQALRNAPPAALRDVDGLVALAEALGAGLGRAAVAAAVAAAALEAGDEQLAEKLALQLAREGTRCADVFCAWVCMIPRLEPPAATRECAVCRAHVLSATCCAAPGGRWRRAWRPASGAAARAQGARCWPSPCASPPPNSWRRCCAGGRPPTRRSSRAPTPGRPSARSTAFSPSSRPSKPRSKITSPAALLTPPRTPRPAGTRPSCWAACWRWARRRGGGGRGCCATRRRAWGTPRRGRPTCWASPPARST
jgi:hypothetical protein